MLDAITAVRSEVPSDGTLCCLEHNVDPNYLTKMNYKRYHGLVKPCRASLGPCPAHVTPYPAPAKLYQACNCPDDRISQTLPTSQSPLPTRGCQPSKPTRCSPLSTISNSRQQDWTTLVHVGSRLAFGWPRAWVMGWHMFSHAYRPIAGIHVALAPPYVQSLCSNACSSCAARRIIPCAAMPTASARPYIQLLSVMSSRTRYCRCSLFARKDLLMRPSMYERTLKKPCVARRWRHCEESNDTCCSGCA